MMNPCPPIPFSCTQITRHALRASLIAMAFGFTLNAQAAIRVWTGSGANANWSTPANWGGTPIAAGDDLVFPSEAMQLDNTNDLPPDTEFNSITFSGSGYTIHGNALSLSGATGITAQNASGMNILDLSIKLGAAQTFECAQADAALIVNGDVDLQDYSLTNNATGAIQLAGIVSGTGSFFKIGPGTLTLGGSSDNTFSGPVEVQEGVLELGKTSASALRDNASLTAGDSVGDAGTDVVRYVASGNQIDSSVALTVTGSGLVDLNGFNDGLGHVTMIGGDIETGAGVLDLIGPLTVNTNHMRQSNIKGQVNLPETLVIDVTEHWWSPDLYLSANCSGPGGITKEGPGEIELSGENSFDGVFAVNQGGVTLSSDTACGSTSSGTIVNSNARIAVLFGTHIDGESLVLATNGDSISAGSLWAGYGSNSWTGPVTLEGNTTINVYFEDDLLTLSGNITGTGNINKIRGGTLLLAAGANNTFAGSTVVQGGTVIIDSLQPQVPVSVESEAVLGGSGTAGAITVSSGTVAPGTSPGILTAGDVIFNSSTMFTVELNGVSPGSGYDQLNVVGSVNLGDAVLDPSLGFAGAAGSNFTLIQNDGADPITGTFQNLAEGASFAISGFPFEITYVGGDGNDVVLTQLSDLPIPTLSIETTPSTDLRLMWPADPPEFVLQMKENLGSGPWLPVETAPTEEGGNNLVVLPMDAPRMFYRLISPPPPSE